MFAKGSSGGGCGDGGDGVDSRGSSGGFWAIAALSNVGIAIAIMAMMGSPWPPLLSTLVSKKKKEF